MGDDALRIEESSAARRRVTHRGAKHLDSLSPLEENVKVVNLPGFRSTFLFRKTLRVTGGGWGQAFRLFLLGSALESRLCSLHSKLESRDPALCNRDAAFIHRLCTPNYFFYNFSHNFALFFVNFMKIFKMSLKS